MAVTPLTDAQRRAADALVQAGRVEQVPVDLLRCVSFLTQAAAALGDLPERQASAEHLQPGYDAAHDVGEAMRAAHGCRTRRGSGQHDAGPHTWSVARCCWQ